MRITGGGLKGRSIPNKKLDLRPTTNRAKQGLLNILHHRLDWENCNALDLFSGTGSITYELSSRGCKQITAIDISPANIGFIRNNVKTLGLNNVIIVRSDALSFLRSHKEPYDLIIADPPYDYHHYPILPELIFEKHLLKETGLLVIEHSKRTSFKENPFFMEQRNYGEVNFSFFGYAKPEVKEE
jgi:16S rRNA (guanine966-N2)-methyltransferase